MMAKFLFFREFLLIVTLCLKINEIDCIRKEVGVRHGYVVAILQDDKDIERMDGLVEFVRDKWKTKTAPQFSCLDWKAHLENKKAKSKPGRVERAENDDDDMKNPSSANECVSYSMKKVCPTRGGEKHDKCIVLVLTECAFNETEALRLVVEEWKKLDGNLALICVLKMKDNEYVLKDPEAYKQIEDSFPVSDKIRLINYTTQNNLLHDLNKLVPTVLVTIQDCEYLNVTTGCYYNVSEKKCIEVYTKNITKEPKVVEEGTYEDAPKLVPRECPEWQDVTGNCSDSKCACKNFNWTFGECSVSCGNGTKPAWRNVSRNPNCTANKTKSCRMKPCPTTTTSTTTTTTLPTTTSAAAATSTMVERTTIETSVTPVAGTTVSSSIMTKISQKNATSSVSGTSSPITEKTEDDDVGVENGTEMMQKTDSSEKSSISTAETEMVQKTDSSEKTSISTVKTTTGKKSSVSEATGLNSDPFGEKQGVTNKGEDSDDTWIIVGSVVGAVLLVVLIAMILFIITKRRRRHKSQNMAVADVKKKHTHGARVSTSVRSEREEAVLADIKSNETVRKGSKQSAQLDSRGKPDLKSKSPSPTSKGSPSPSKGGPNLVAGTSPLGSRSPTSQGSRSRSPSPTGDRVPNLQDSRKPPVSPSPTSQGSGKPPVSPSPTSQGSGKPPGSPSPTSQGGRSPSPAGNRGPNLQDSRSPPGKPSPISQGNLISPVGVGSLTPKGKASVSKSPGEKQKR